MNHHVADFLRHHGRMAPEVYSGTRAASPAALLRAAARRAHLSLDQVDRHVYVMSLGRRVVGGFSIPLTSLSSTQSVQVSRSLPLSKQHLELEGLPVPAGAVFQPHQMADAVRHFQNMSAPAVVKPAMPKSGDGVTLKVTEQQALIEAWRRASGVLREKGAHDIGIVVEEFVEGINVRAFVVGEKVVAAIARVPLFCVGDGLHTVRERASEVTASRYDHPLLGRIPIPTIESAADTGQRLDARSIDGQVYPLGSRVDARSGGLTIDVTSLLTNEVREVAVSSLWAIPGAHAAGVDMLVPHVSATSGATVLHVDVECPFTPHHYPWMGGRRQVASTLIQRMIEISNA